MQEREFKREKKIDKNREVEKDICRKMTKRIKIL